jgi:deoxyribonuclease-4
MSFRVGAHVSISGGPQKAVERQEDIDGDCGQIFAGSPRTWSVSSYEDSDGDAFTKARNETDQNPYVIHSTYLVNLATPKEDLAEKSLQCLQDELNAAETLGVEYVVFHPGAHTGAGRQTGIENIADRLEQLDVPADVTLLLENTAGKGTTLGKSMGELREMISKTGADTDDLGVCIDTCHAHAAGYELRDQDGFEDFLQELDEDLGLENLDILHLNDSKDERGSEKDNHEHIGEGNIGLDGFRNVMNADKLRDTPMVLETPVEDHKGYADNLEVIKDLID